MDVLRPPLIYVDGRCYRINDQDCYNESKQTGVEWDDNPSSYGNNEYSNYEQCDAGDDFDITVTDNGRHKTSFHVARVYYAPIIGVKGQTRKRIEDETKTIIKVPRQPNEHEIVITGPSKQAVVSARRRVQMMVLSYRKKQQFTHFLSVAMVSPTVKEGFLKFKDGVLQNCKSRGVDESIFQNPDKLHMTLCTMVLTDNVERSEAVSVLERCKHDMIDPLMEGHSCTVLLEGVEYMNDDPTEVDVLYAKVQANRILQTLVDGIVDYCSNAGLIDKQFERVKLHVTIMNTLFRDAKDELYGQSTKRETFNAVPILERFQNYEFGEVQINGIHLSTRFTTSKTDGYYQSTTQISLLM